MRYFNLIALLLFAALLAAESALADTKITDLPAGTGAGTISTDVFPYVDTANNKTKKMTVWDIVNLPPFSSAWTVGHNLPGYASTTGTITSADTLLSAIEKLDGNVQSISAAAISIGAFDGQVAAANGMTLVGNILYAQSADATHPGMLNIGSQTIAGTKTFSSTISGSVNGNAATATALASSPAQCSSGNYSTGIATSGAANCSQVAYSQLSGTPTIYYQTVQSNAVAQTQRANLNFSTQFTSTDSLANNRTTIDLASTITSSTSGNAATASAWDHTPTACSANQYATSQSTTGALTCSQVAYSQVTGTPTLHYQTVQSGAVSQTQRSNLNFTSEFSLADSAGSDRSSVSIASGGVTNAMLASSSTTVSGASCALGGSCTVPYSGLSGAPTIYYQTVQANGTNQTQRGHLNFSSLFSLTDSAGSDNSTVDVAANGVTNAKLATMGSYTVKGNDTNAAATPTDLAASSLNDIVARADLQLANALTVEQTTDSSTGNVAALSTANTTSIRLTGAAPVIQGIGNGSLGRLITLHNATGVSVTVSNQNASATAANRILTGTGADLTIAADASLLLLYDNTTTRWRVVGGSGSAAGTVTTTGSPASGQVAVFSGSSSVTSNVNGSLGSTNALTVTMTNDGTTGTSVNKLAKLNGSGQAVKMATTDTNGAVGIVVSGAGTTSTAEVAVYGTATCTFDNAATYGDYVGISGGTAGDCTDLGADQSGAAGQIIGIARESGAAGPRTVYLIPGNRAGAPTVSRYITQSAHGFSVGNWLYYTGSAYALAKADADSTSEVLGIVSAVPDTSHFVLVTSGYVSTITGATAGTNYLSDSSAGAMTTTEPTQVGHIDKPVFFADSATSGYILNQRGVTIAQQAAMTNALWRGHYATSGTIYWANSSGGVYGDFSPTATPPSIVEDYNYGFGTVTIPASSLPGMAFTAAYTGTIEFCVSASGDSGGAEATDVKMVSGSTYIGNLNTSYMGAGVSLSWSGCGYLDVVKNTAYTMKLQGEEHSGTTFYIGNTSTADASLNISAKYVRMTQ